MQHKRAVQTPSRTDRKLKRNFLRLVEVRAMKCEKAQQNIVLVTYGELPDEEWPRWNSIWQSARRAIAS